MAGNGFAVEYASLQINNLIPMNRLFGRRRQEKKNTATDGPGYSHLDIANRNMRVVMEALRRAGPYSRQELSTLTGLTQTALTTILRKLQSAGYVREQRRQKVEGERYTQNEFWLNADGALAIGLRVRQYNSELLLLDITGQVRAHEYCPAIADLPAALAQFRQCGAGQGKCIGIGVVCDREVAIDMAQIQEVVPELPFYQRSDIGAAVMAEHLLGSHNTHDGAVMVIIDDTVRAGLLVSGRPFEGVHGLAGRIGMMRTGKDRTQLNDSLSTRTLMPLLDEGQWNLLKADHQDSCTWTPELEHWVQNAASHLLDATVAIAGFLAPGVIMIGGDLPKPMIERLISDMKAEQIDKAKRLMTSPWMPEITASTFVHGGIAVGAALLPFQQRLLPYAGY